VAEEEDLVDGVLEGFPLGLAGVEDAAGGCEVAADAVLFFFEQVFVDVVVEVQAEEFAPVVLKFSDLVFVGGWLRCGRGRRRCGLIR